MKSLGGKHWSSDLDTLDMRFSSSVQVVSAKMTLKMTFEFHNDVELNNYFRNGLSHKNTYKKMVLSGAEI
jgi:hypothetical protein